jgi:hypothetical protein
MDGILLFCLYLLQIIIEISNNLHEHLTVSALLCDQCAKILYNT